MQSKLHVDLRCFQIEATAATTAVAGSPLSWHIPRPSLVGRSERDSENGSWAHHLHPNSPSRGSTSSQGSTASTHVSGDKRVIWARSGLLSYPITSIKTLSSISVNDVNVLDIFLSGRIVNGIYISIKLNLLIKIEQELNRIIFSLINYNI